MLTSCTTQVCYRAGCEVLVGHIILTPQPRQSGGYGGAASSHRNIVPTHARCLQRQPLSICKLITALRNWISKHIKRLQLPADVRANPTSNLASVQGGSLREQRPDVRYRLVDLQRISITQIFFLFNHFRASCCRSDSWCLNTPPI